MAMCESARTTRHTSGVELPPLFIATRAQDLWLPPEVRGLPIPPPHEFAGMIPPELLPQRHFRAVRRARLDDDPTAEDHLLWATPTAADLGLPGASLEVAVQLVRDVPFLPSMRGLSVLAAELYHAGTDPTRHLRLARELFGGAFLAKIEAWVAGGRNRAVFDARHLATVQRLLVMHAADDDPPDGLGENDWRRLAGALFVVANVLPHNEPDEPAHHQDVDWDGWARYTVQAGLWYEQPYVAEAIARAWSQYVTTAKDLTEHHAACEVEEWMRTDYDGAGLAAQLGAGLAYAVGSGALDPALSFAERSNRRPNRGYLVDTHLRELEPALVSAISADRTQFRGLLEATGDDPMQVAWDHAAFEVRPFLREPNGTLVLLSPRALVSWLTRGIHYRLLDAGNARRDSRGNRLGKRWLDYAGALGEESVRRLLAGSLNREGSAAGSRFHGEFEYQGLGGRQDSPDAALDAWPELVLFEVYSGRLSRAAKTTGDPEEMRTALRQAVVEKLEELLARVKDVLDGSLEYPQAVAPPRRITPVLVLAGDSVLQTPFLWGWLRQELPALVALAGDPRVRRPIICDLDDLEPMLALVERGESLPALLAQFLASNLSEYPPRNWLAQRGVDLSARPQYVKEQCTAAVRAGAAQLYPDSTRLTQLSWDD